MTQNLNIPRHRILTLHSIVSGLIALVLFLAGVGFAVLAVVRLL